MNTFRKNNYNDNEIVDYDGESYDNEIVGDVEKRV